MTPLPGIVKRIESRLRGDPSVRDLLAHSGFTAHAAEHWRTVLIESTTRCGESWASGERQLSLIDIMARLTADLIERARSEDALRVSGQRGHGSRGSGARAP